MNCACVGYAIYSSITFPGSFVSDVIRIYYTSDERVQEDEEIQAFVKDVCSFGMQDFDYCGTFTSLHKLLQSLEKQKS